MFNPFENMQNLMNQDKFLNNFRNMEALNISVFSDMLRKNMESFAAANQMVNDSLQSIMKRGNDSLQKNTSEMFSSMREAVASGDVEQLNSSSQRFMKNSVDNNVRSSREIVEVAAKSSMEILDLIGKSFNENCNKSMQKQPSPATAKK